MVDVRCSSVYISNEVQPQVHETLRDTLRGIVNEKEKDEDDQAVGLSQLSFRRETPPRFVVSR